MPMLTVSALEKKRVTNIFPLIDDIITERKKRIPTAELNKSFSEIRSTMTPPLYKGKAGKLNYITQVRIEPPSFTVLMN